jgi:hypothetical protein
MGELVNRPDVIPLSLHIDYWDSPVWRDQFALPEATARQRMYKKSFAMKYVYTPQVVVGGRAHVSGRLRDQIEGLIAEARRRDSLPVILALGPNNTVTVELPGESMALAPLTDRAPSDVAHEQASVWMILYDRPHTVDIRAGANAGQRIIYYNVVREMKRIGSWSGTAQSITLPIGEAAIRERAGIVIMLQQSDGGPILGAAVLPFDPKKSS